MSKPDELAALSNEAAALLEKARLYRSQMEALPANDPQRPQLEAIVRDLLDSANSLSDAVKSRVSKK